MGFSSSLLLLERARVTFPRPTNPTGMLTQLSRIDYSAPSLSQPRSSHESRKARKRKEGERERGERERSSSVYPADCTAISFRTGADRRRGGKGSIPPERIPLPRERTMSEGICLTNNGGIQCLFPNAITLNLNAFI